MATTTASRPQQDRLLGIGLRIAATTCFAFMAAMIKLGYAAGVRFVTRTLLRANPFKQCLSIQLQLLPHFPGAIATLGIGLLHFVSHLIHKANAMLPPFLVG